MTAEIRTGRWQDVLPGTYDPARAVVITDPPFGLNATGGQADRDGVGPFDKGFEDSVPWARHVAEALELLPAVRHVIRGSASVLTGRDHPAPRRLMVEVATFRRRATHRPGVVPFLWNGWAVYGRLRIGPRRRAPSGDARLVGRFRDDLRARPRPGDRLHRGMTPYDAALWMIETWADDGFLVLDPFAGVGTIGQAAGSLGFDYLGAEVDPGFAAEGRAALEVVAPLLAL